MKYKAGDIFPPINVETSKGANLALPDPNARYTHVQFRRFSGCPMCNTHIASLRQGKDRLDAAGIHEVLFFHSSQQEVASFHADLPFDAIGDKEKRYYKKFGVESSFFYLSWKALAAAFPTLMRGQFTLKATGGIFGLPDEFLVDSNGRIKAAHYGKDAYDQWSVDEILSLTGAA